MSQRVEEAGASAESLLLTVPRSRWLFMGEKLAPPSGEFLVRRLHELSAENQGALVLEIHCDSADYWTALRLYDFIRLGCAPVIGFVSGSIGRVALVVLQACQTRIAGPEANMLLQHPDDGIELTLLPGSDGPSLIAKLARHKEDAERRRRAIQDILMARTGRSADDLRPFTKGERPFMSAQDGLSEGLIDLLLHHGIRSPGPASI
jgi:ATP-dependent protease ClpP protease subunit